MHHYYYYYEETKKNKIFPFEPKKKENASQCTKHSRTSPDIIISHYAQIKKETFSENATRYHDMKYSVTKKIYKFSHRIRKVQSETLNFHF